MKSSASLQRMRAAIRIATLWILAGACPSLLSVDTPTNRPDAWRQDLAMLSASLPQLHRNLFFQLREEDFLRAAEELDRDIPTLDDNRIILRLAQLTAMAGDAHTNLDLRQPAVPFRFYPIQLQWFSDGIFVTQTSSEHSAALGKRLIRIGTTDIARAFREAEVLIAHENEPWLQQVSQDYLTIPEVLHGLGIVADEERAPFVFADAAGSTLVLTLKPVDRTTGIDWIRAADQVMPRPLYLKNLNQLSSAGYRIPYFTYWGDYLTDPDLFYFQYNACRSDTGLPFSFLADLVMQSLRNGSGHRLVLDVRNNSGGNSEVIRPLLNGLQQMAAGGTIHPARDLYVIIGRQTMSSGIINAIQMRQLGGTLVGEPTGGKPHSYGNTKNITLSRSNISVSYSTNYYQLQPNDTPSLMPDVEALMSSSDYFQGRDPALAAILKGAPESSAASGFVLYQNGGLVQATSGTGDSPAVGYGVVDTLTPGPTPAALAIFSSRREGITVSEATVAGVVPRAGGRIYVESSPRVRTGIAFANANDVPTTVDFYFSDAAGRNIRPGRLLLGARSHLASYLDQQPFDGAGEFTGTFTWSSTAALGATALRGLLGKEGELLTALPVSGLTPAPGQLQVLAQFADGAGWSTQIALINPTDEPLTGSIEFYGQGLGSQPAAPTILVVNGARESRFAYAVPPRSSQLFSTAGLSVEIGVGSAWILPAAGSASPAAFGIFNYQAGNRVLSTAGIPAMVPRAAIRLLAEASGGFRSAEADSVMTGVALSNPNAEAVTVTLRLRYLNGSTAKGPVNLDLPARGQRALFLHQIPGFETLQTPFQGILVITVASGNVAVAGLRARYNERGEFLMASIPVVDEDEVGRPLLLPHLVDAGGYSTRVALISPLGSQNAAGSILFFDPTGKPWRPILR